MIHSHTCFQGLCAVLAGTALSHADEPAVSISDFGVDKVMSGPVVSINDQYKGVVKIEMDSLTPDYATPWNTGRYQGGIGTGFLIGENAFMTNAHVVSNAERIYISMYGDSRKIPARVKFIAHDADLALLEATAKLCRVSKYRIYTLTQLQEAVFGKLYRLHGMDIPAFVQVAVVL